MPVITPPIEPAGGQTELNQSTGIRKFTSCLLKHEMSTAVSHTELRLLVLDVAESGHNPTISAILGLEDLTQGKECADGSPCCRIQSGALFGKQVTVVSSPTWFGSQCTQEDRKKMISSFITLCSPGPHAFLLCIPVNQPANGEERALDVLEKVFGSSAVSSSTIVLFTQLQELEEDEQLEDYLFTWRKDLLRVVERCGEHYHTLETITCEEEKRGAAEKLLEKVEQMVGNNVNKHFSCLLFQKGEELKQTEENKTEEEMEAMQSMAESSTGELDMILNSIFPPESVSSSPTAPSFLWSLWEMMTSWVISLPSLVRREALLGALVGFFVGGPYGGVVGASVGSVATEVKRRKMQKNK